MSDLDVLSFMQRNGSGFFDSEGIDDSDSGVMVDFSVNISILKSQLEQFFAECQHRGVTIEELLAEVVGEFLNDC